MGKIPWPIHVLLILITGGFWVLPLLVWIGVRVAKS